MIDATAPLGKGDRFVANRVSSNAICVVNKIDAASQPEILSQLTKAGELGLSAYFPVSARTGEGIDTLVDAIVARLPEGPQYYPDGMISDAGDGFWVSELVREQLLKIENRSLQDKLSATQPAPATSLQGQADFARSDTPACRSAKRDVEVAATSIENNKALIRARQSAMYVACGIREPDKQVTNINAGHRSERGDRPYVDPRRSTR